MLHTVYLFTNSFPFGKHETFLETEIKFLADRVAHVVIVPLYISGSQRTIPENVSYTKPLISFSPKQRTKLLIKGLFNFSPLSWCFREFFERRVYKNKQYLRPFVTSFLLTRAMLPNKTLLRKLSKETTPDDIFYFYWGDKSVLLLPFLRLKNKVYVRFHRSDIYEEAKQGYIPFRKEVFRQISFFIPISEHGKRYLLANYPYVVPERITVARLGVTDNGLNPPAQPHNPIHLVSCSSLESVKRVDLLIEALGKLNIEIEWTHFGGGSLEKPLKALSQKLPANIHVKWCGMVSNSEVIRYYQTRHVDVFVNVSSSEGIPVSIMEAMSFGIPALATNVGGVSELVNNKNGVLLPKDITSQRLADELLKFIQSPILPQFRQNARAHWKSYFHDEKNYRAFITLLTSGTSSPHSL